jgi:3',5'-cyclic AMP phosphodiesterase CpdA
MTDLHMRDRNRAAEGIALAVAKVRSLRPRADMVIVGGDAGDGLMAGDSAAALKTFQALEDAFKPLEVPVHWVVGNHDIIGWGRSGADASDPSYGKSTFTERFIKGSSYRALEHKGWKIILLDSIQKSPDGASQPYVAAIDDRQMDWLKSQLNALSGSPAILVTHAPMLSSYFIYNDGPYAAPKFPMVLQNAKELHELLKDYPVKAVLQGHTHVRENVVYAGRQHITSGAVCGNWWQGPRFGIDPEGFSVIDLRGDSVEWSYLPTGFRAEQG